LEVLELSGFCGDPASKWRIGDASFDNIAFEGFLLLGKQNSSYCYFDFFVRTTKLKIKNISANYRENEGLANWKSPTACVISLGNLSSRYIKVFAMIRKK